VTEIQISSDPTARPIGGADAAVNVWRRLLIMRAMGLVPWSGMNVACGVVGVDWKTFWLTTAAGSASWSYVTASVGNILSRLALPIDALDAAGGDGTNMAMQGESVTNMLRDPVLIAKLVFLTMLTLVPVLLKRRAAPSSTTSESDADSVTTNKASPVSGVLSVLHRFKYSHLEPASPPMSPLSQSSAQFTPTPASFDLLSFGHRAVRNSARAAVAGVRMAAGGVARLGAAAVSAH
jgi:hypothetical protein